MNNQHKTRKTKEEQEIIRLIELWINFKHPTITPKTMRQKADKVAHSYVSFRCLHNAFHPLPPPYGSIN